MKLKYCNTIIKYFLMKEVVSDIKVAHIEAEINI